MTHDQLILLQSVMALVSLALLAVAALYLVIGLIRPSLVGSASRWRIIGRTLAMWVLAFAAYGGTIAYTHSHPNGPHALSGYLDDYFKEQCAQGADIPACKEQQSPPRPQ